MRIHFHQRKRPVMADQSDHQRDWTFKTGDWSTIWYSMLTALRHSLFIFVCGNDFLCFFFVFVFCFFTQHCKKHINMLIVFFEREDDDRR